MWMCLQFLSAMSSLFQTRAVHFAFDQGALPHECLFISNVGFSMENVNYADDG